MALGSIFLLHSLHHRRWCGLGLLHFYREVAQHGIIELEAGFDFDQCFVVALDVQANIVCLGEFLDNVGQLTTAPVFDAVNLAAVGGDDRLVALDHRGHLLALIRMDDKYDFIMTHAKLLLDGLNKSPTSASRRVWEEENRKLYAKMAENSTHSSAYRSPRRNCRRFAPCFFINTV